MDAENRATAQKRPRRKGVRGSPDVWFRKGRGWTCTIGGRQIFLHKSDEKKAREIAKKLRARIGDRHAGPVALTGDLTPLRGVLALFLEHKAANARPATVAWYKGYLERFSAVHGAMPVGKLLPFHLTQWLDKQGYAGEGRIGPTRVVKAALEWARKQKLIGANPLADMPIGKVSRREGVLTADQRTAVRARAGSQAFRDLLTALEETGCRVNEARTVESRHVVRDAAGRPVAWAFPASEAKAGQRSRRPRLVPLNSAAGELTDRLAERHPAGPLFRNSRGGPWTRNAIRCTFRRIRAQVEGLPPNLCGTTYRHTKGTELARGGANLDAIREIMGHADLSMLEEWYLHGQHLDDLRGILEGGSKPPLGRQRVKRQG